MSDLVERLRGAAAQSLNEYGEADRYREAADEIERLQRLVGDMLHAQHKQERTNILQEAEIERLRATVLLAAEALKTARPVMEWARDTGSRDDREVASWALSRIDAVIHCLKQEGW